MFTWCVKLVAVSGVEGLESVDTPFNSFWQHHLYSAVSQAGRAGPGAARKRLQQVWHQLFCLAGDNKALGQGHTTWTIVLSHKMPFKCKFPLGPKGDLASALALLVWTDMWSALICIMGRMKMRGELCQPKTKRRKKIGTGGQNDAVLLSSICTPQRCAISWTSLDHFKWWSQVILISSTLMVWQRPYY